MPLPDCTPSSLAVPRRVLRAAEERMLTTPDVESCGFLIGRVEGGEARVETMVFATNVSGLPDRFAISPREHQRVLEQLPEGQSLIGVFHSHLADPSPSDADRSGMRFYTGIWMIVGYTGKRRLTALACVAFLPAEDSLKALDVRVL